MGFWSVNSGVNVRFTFFVKMRKTAANLRKAHQLSGSQVQVKGIRSRV